MAHALILSSYVAATRIGGAAQQLVLAALGFEPVLVPTVLFGRSPAHGGRGQPVEAELFSRMLQDIEAAGVFETTALVITGHFSLPAQVAAAAEVIARVRAVSLAPIVVDPILGDAPKGLYVKPEVARSVAGRLVPAADWITPNLWELGYLTGAEPTDLAAATAAARALGRPALITSAPADPGEIGLACVEGEAAWLYAHARREQVPNGTGDLVCAVFAAGLAQGLAPQAAAERAARAAALAVEAARGAADLPITSLALRWMRPDAEVRIERL